MNYELPTAKQSKIKKFVVSLPLAFLVIVLVGSVAKAQQKEGKQMEEMLNAPFSINGVLGKWEMSLLELQERKLSTLDTPRIASSRIKKPVSSVPISSNNHFKERIDNWEVNDITSVSKLTQKTFQPAKNVSLVSAGKHPELGPQVSVGEEISWKNPALSDWNTNKNWNPERVPGNGDNVFIDNGGTAAIDSEASYGNLSLGSAKDKSGNLQINKGGNLTGEQAILGGQIGNVSDEYRGTGSAIIDGGIWTNRGDMYIGKQGTGSVSITHGGKLTINDSLFIGAQHGGSGSVTLEDGGELIVDQRLQVGGMRGNEGGKGLLTVTNGRVIAGKLYIGGFYFQDSSGTVKVNEGGYIRVNGEFAVGSAGTGVLEINNGGVVDADDTRVSAFWGHTIGKIELNEGGLLSTKHVWAQANAESQQSFVFNGGTLQAKESTPDFITNFRKGEIILEGKGGTIDTQEYNVRLDSADITGIGGLTKIGTGTLTITADGSYTGGTHIDQGTFEIGDGGTRGSIVGNIEVKTGALLAFNRSDVFGVNGDITGEGGVLQKGSGTTVLGSNNNSYSGETTIEKGTLSQSKENAFSPNSTVSIKNQAALDMGGFDGVIGGLEGEAGSKVTESQGRAVTLHSGANNSSGVFAGVIEDGNGQLSLDKVGTGQLTLTGENTYTGSTVITSGTLQIGDGGNRGSIPDGPIKDEGALVFNRSDEITRNGIISGNGTLTQAGSGALTLRGNNTYSGGTLVKSGTLIGDTHSLQGGIQLEDKTDLVFNNQTLSGDFNGNITGVGTVHINNDRIEDKVTFKANDNQTYGGNTLIEKGTLELNGQLSASNVQIQKDGILTGTGTASRDVVNAGVLDSVVAKDNKSASFVKIDGNYTQKSGGLLRVRFADATHFAQLHVKGQAV